VSAVLAFGEWASILLWSLLVFFTAPIGFKQYPVASDGIFGLAFQAQPFISFYRRAALAGELDRCHVA